jgi:hypothetical protein
VQNRLWGALAHIHSCAPVAAVFRCSQQHDSATRRKHDTAYPGTPGGADNDLRPPSVELQKMAIADTAPNLAQVRP